MNFVEARSSSTAVLGHIPLITAELLAVVPNRASYERQLGFNWCLWLLLNLWVLRKRSGDTVAIQETKWASGIFWVLYDLPLNLLA